MQKIIFFFQKKIYFTNKNKNIIAFLFILLFIPTFLVSQVGAGLDLSWILGLNISIKNNQIFGQDYIFTYGILGYLQTKCTYNVSKWYLVLFDLYLLFNIFLLMKYVLKKVNFLYEYIIIFFICLLVGRLNFFRHFMLSDIIMLCGGGLLLVATFEKQKYSLISLAFLCGLSIHIKISYGFLLAIMFFVGILYLLWQKIFSYQWLVLATIIYLGTFLGIALYHNVNIVGYFLEGSEIISGYNESMFLVSEPINLILGLLLIVFFVASSYFQFKNTTQKIPFLFLFFVTSFVLFYTFKAQFVRAEGRQFIFFGQICGILGLYILYLEKKLLISKRLFAISLSICAVVISYNKISEQQYEFNALFSVQYFKDIFGETAHRNKIDENRKAFLPKSIVDTIGKKSVDILPTEISMVYSYNLSYNPRPIPQSYSAYTPRLDRLNANKYSSKNAPDFLIFSNQSIDNRYNFWDESFTKLAILENYDFMDINRGIKEDIAKKFDENYYLDLYPDLAQAKKLNIIKSGYEHYINHGKNEGRIPYPDYFDMLTFQKSKKRKKIKTTFLKNTTETLGVPIKIENYAKMLYIYPKIEYNILGNITKVFYRPPMIQAKIKYENGKEEIFKAIAPILKGGILVNYKMSNNQDAINFFENNLQKNQKINEITFFSNEDFFVSKKIEILWEEKELIH